MKSRSSQLRVGFLGVGSIAKFHAEVLEALNHIVTTGCGTNRDSPRWHDFKKVAPEAFFENDIRKVLNNPDIDAIVSCLPWNVTELWLQEILETPKPILIEKPIALSSKTLSRILNKRKINIRNKYVGFNRRFYDTVQALKERVASGGIKSVEIIISEAAENLSKIYGPKILDNLLAYSSSHILDTALYILGSLSSKKIYKYSETTYSRSFSSLMGILEDEKGTPVLLSIYADNPTPVGIRIFFEDRSTWHLSPIELLIAYRGYELIEPEGRVKIRRYIPKPFLEITEDTKFKPGFLSQMEAFTNGNNRHIAALPKESLSLLSFIESL